MAHPQPGTELQEKPRPSAVSLGGRPTREQSEQLGEKIVETAASLFLTDGYGATSIDAIVKRAQVSKRTFYHRYQNKAVLFRAVVHWIIERIRPPHHTRLFEGSDIETVLRRVAELMVHAAVEPNVLALNRLIIAEGSRFPELAAAVVTEGAGANAIKELAYVLRRETQAERMALDDCEFAAATLMQMVIAIPQRRALGMGTPMTATERSQWAEKAVTLFLNGCCVKS